MLEVKDDERFERHGDDLIMDLPLSFSQAALGMQITVPTPYGDEQVSVARRHPGGTVLRLKGQGPAAAGSERQGRSAHPNPRLDAGVADRRAGSAVPASWRSSRASRPSGTPASGRSSRRRWARDAGGAIDVQAEPERRERGGAGWWRRTGQAVEEREDGTLVSFALDRAAADALVEELPGGAGPEHRHHDSSNSRGGLDHGMAPAAWGPDASVGSP